MPEAKSGRSTRPVPGPPMHPGRTRARPCCCSCCQGVTARERTPRRARATILLSNVVVRAEPACFRVHTTPPARTPWGKHQRGREKKCHEKGRCEREREREKERALQHSTAPNHKEQESRREAVARKPACRSTQSTPPATKTRPGTSSQPLTAPQVNDNTANTSDGSRHPHTHQVRNTTSRFSGRCGHFERAPRRPQAAGTAGAEQAANENVAEQLSGSEKGNPGPDERGPREEGEVCPPLENELCREEDRREGVEEVGKELSRLGWEGKIVAFGATTQAQMQSSCARAVTSRKANRRSG